MSRCKRHSEHVSHDRWLVSYADFITLLFAFFVVLYSSAHVDKRKVGRLALAIQVAFQQMGVFDTSSTEIPLNDSEAVPFSKVQVVENSEQTADLTKFGQPMKGTLVPSSNAPLKNIQDDLKKASAAEIQRQVVDVKAPRDALVISLLEIAVFDSGSATLRASSRDALDRFAAVLW